MDAISRKLGADALLEGSAGLVDGRVRLTVRLVHGATDRQLWSATYESGLSDVLALQGELAEAHRRGGSGHDHERRADGARDPQFCEPRGLCAVLAWRSLRQPAKSESVRRGIEYYQQALALDPT
jgi:hypothetical protein